MFAELVYHNFKDPEVRKKVLEQWRDYKFKFGLEGDLYFNDKGKRRQNDIDIQKDIIALRQLRSELRK